MIILSHFQAEPLLKAKKEGKADATTSPDLGLTGVQVSLDEQGVTFPGGERCSWEDIRKIARRDNQCFVLEGGGVRNIHVYSETTHWVRTLFPTAGAPTTIVGGFSMHRIKGVDPHADTLLKVKAIAPIVGRVLDTATGLGYTAIEAARTATEVVTIELDPAALEIARYNPWSAQLFSNPRVKQIVGDAYDEVRKLESDSFARIIHDPPAFELGGDLYSAEFYGQLFRLLQRGGRLFHYIGDLESRSGRVVTKGSMQRLEAVGFKRITRRPEAFGVVAYK